MNRSVLPALMMAALAGLGGYGLANHAGAQAGPAAQIADGSTPPPGMPGGGGEGGPDGWEQHRGMMGMDGGWLHHGIMMHVTHARDWGLFYPPADKKLSVADVQTIAQAILLRHGNHTWKVAEIVQNQDDTVSFAFATPGGDVIARFAMDTHTSRLHRLG